VITNGVKARDRQSSRTRIVTIDQLRASRRFVAAKPQPRRRGLRSPALLALPFVDAVPAAETLTPSLREWLALWLKRSKAGIRNTTLMLALADGESSEAAAKAARISRARACQIATDLTRAFDVRLDSFVELAAACGHDRHELLRLRSQLTQPQDLHHIAGVS
jgi:hypothetical protein